MKISCMATLMVAALTCACTHNVDLMGTDAPASEVMANRRVTSPTIYSFSDDLKDAKATTEVGAHTYVVSIGPAIVRTIRAANQIGFDHAQEGQPQTRAPYNIRIQLDEVQGRIVPIPGFWIGKAGANIDVSGKVDVTDGQGNEVTRAIIEGEGNAVDTDPSEALRLAGEKAIKRLGTDYVYKVINTNVLK